MSEVHPKGFNAVSMPTAESERSEQIKVQTEASLKAAQYEAAKRFRDNLLKKTH